jgi:hypothetical protein
MVSDTACQLSIRHPAKPTTTPRAGDLRAIAGLLATGPRRHHPLRSDFTPLR